MNIGEQQLEDIRIWGRYNLPAEKMAILLELNKEERAEFLMRWNDPDDQIRLMWEQGRAKSEIEVMESLEHFSMKEEEGSGEAAKALGYVKSRQRINQLKSDLFNV